MTAFAGFAFVVMTAAAALLVADAPAAGASAADVADYFDDAHVRIVTSVYLQGLALALFVWFLSGLAWRLHSGGAPLRARVAYGAGLIAMTLFGLAAVVLGALAFRATDDTSLAQSLFDVAVFSQNTAAFPIAVLVAAGWRSWRGAVLAAIFLVDAATVAEDGFFAPDGGYSRVAAILFLGWVAAASAELLFPGRPAPR
jgi:hypothetical protein